MIDLNTALDIAEKVVSLAAVIAAVTPTPKDDGVLKVVRTVVDWCAFNFGHAKNQPRD